MSGDLGSSSQVAGAQVAGVRVAGARVAGTRVVSRVTALDRARTPSAHALTSRVAEWLRVHGPATTLQIVAAFAGQTTPDRRPLNASRIGSALEARARAALGDVVRHGRTWHWVPERERGLDASAPSAGRDASQPAPAAGPGASPPPPIAGPDSLQPAPIAGPDSLQPARVRSGEAPTPAAGAGAAPPRTFRPPRPYVPAPLVVRQGALDHRRLPSRIGETVVAYAGVECAG